MTVTKTCQAKPLKPSNSVANNQEVKSDPRSEDDVLWELLTRYDYGRRHGLQQMLDSPALEVLALRIRLLESVVATLSAELSKRDRTIEAYRRLIHDAT